MIPLSAPHIAGNEWKYVKECLDSGWVSSVGSYVDRFENDIAKYTGARYAVATVNGTAALHLSLKLLGVECSDEVLVPTLTFIAPVNTVQYLGANPVFMDCDDYLNIDPVKTAEFCEKECRYDGKNLINKTSGAKVKAIILVHIFGHPVDIAPFMELADKFNLKIVEDATESLGSFYIKGRYETLKTGVIGDIGCYSFNGNKIITTGGGGMMVTRSEEIAKKAKYLSTQAKDDSERFVHNEIGFNYRLTNVLSAMGCAQMESLERYVTMKRKNFEVYQEQLIGIRGLSLIKEPDYSFSNYWYYTLVVNADVYGEDSAHLGRRLKEKGVETRPIWELNHKQHPYKDFQAYKIEKAIKFQRDCLSLPCSIGIKTDDINRVCELIAG